MEKCEEPSAVKEVPKRFFMIEPLRDRDGGPKRRLSQEKVDKEKRGERSSTSLEGKQEVINIRKEAKGSLIYSRRQNSKGKADRKT